MNEASTAPLSLQDLPELRRKTEAVARMLQAQLAQHLETIRPVLAPERFLGRYAKGDSPQGERTLAELQQNYRQVTGPPFDLPKDFEPAWLSLVGNRLDLYPWEYTYDAKADGVTKAITMTSPLKWVVTLGCDYNLAQVRRVLSEKDSLRVDRLRQFVVNALVIGLAISQSPGLGRLFSDLRYELKIEPVPGLGKLPLPTITSCLFSFRPADDLLLAATAFSGVPAFIELLDRDALVKLEDPLKARIGKLLA